MTEKISFAKKVEAVRGNYNPEFVGTGLAIALYSLATGMPGVEIGFFIAATAIVIDAKKRFLYPDVK